MLEGRGGDVLVLEGRGGDVLVLGKGGMSYGQVWGVLVASVLCSHYCMSTACTCTCR